MVRKQGSPEKLRKAAKDIRTPVIKPNKAGNPSGNKHRIKG